ncbi:PaaX family transcriptional regulator C-terminal domain-containing protein [Streptomyces sp. NPDC101132]|uniref:PaaX family transcriptional regulator C-terminal domain-containing protein n=1 Tax=Streptomyces sp. NPDC101132 TaxID=3366110 RepID=UPI0037FB3DE0
MTPDAPRPEIPTRLLVHALVRADGSVDAGELYEVAGALGMTDQQVRLCVKRLVAEGAFTHEGRGRKAVLRAVADPGTGALAPDAEFVAYAYRQDRGLEPWDGRWHLTAFAVPEARRAARDALRDTLLHLGAAPLQGGLYVAANAIEEYVAPAAERLGIRSAVTLLTSTDLRVGELADPVAVAAALWPLAEIARRYESLAALAGHWLARTGALEPVERLTAAVGLAAEFTRAMEPDPLLPPELLPSHWPGARARALTARAWELLAAGGGEEPRLFGLYADALRGATTA